MTVYVHIFPRTHFGLKETVRGSSQCYICFINQRLSIHKMHKIIIFIDAEMKTSCNLI